MNTLKKAGYITILTALGLLAQLKEAKAQFPQVPPPTGILDPFFTEDNTEAARIMNATTTEEERNLLLRQRTQASIIPTIPSPAGRSLDCNDYNIWYLSEATDWIKIGTLYNGDLFGKYTGTATDSILKYKGTFAHKGTIGAKILLYSMKDKVTLPSGHAGNVSFTGDHTLESASHNYIEAHYALTELKPGKIEPSLGQPVIPANCEKLNILWPYTFINNEGKEQLWNQIILTYKITNGVPELIYNINDDPFYNTTLHLITERESNPQGDAPYIKSMTLDGDVLTWDAEEKNKKEIYATVDNGPKIPLSGLSGTKDLNINQTGFYTVTLYVEDYYNLNSEMTKTTNITTALPETTTNYEIKAGPNPVNTHTTIYTPTNTNTTITLTNTTGQTLEKIIDNDGDGQTTINMTNHNSGIYPAIIQYTTPTNTTETTTIKLVKE